MILMHSNGIGCTEHCWRGNDATCGHSFQLTGINLPKVQLSVSTCPCVKSTKFIDSFFMFLRYRISQVSHSIDLNTLSDGLTVLIGEKIPHQSEIWMEKMVELVRLKMWWDGHEIQVSLASCTGSGCYPAALLHSVADLGLKASHLAESCISDLLSAKASHALNIFEYLHSLTDLEGEEHTNKI